ncbi:hypothetical protein TSOC_009134 [Tetrabaena socialis]|uniref:Uncharacterized protein n=1 Tax=Tetrabaena socialis TaxID=47790 RepID=A0A2J7ZWP6_9CHLO|nr:hypothetical protein TSOC_009134 [Tetrabaena socialis]|eukprot:PNH04678.1 hypothetical protein TSOC_009134 [Tetrabaena socialis]
MDLPPGPEPRRRPQDACRDWPPPRREEDRRRTAQSGLSVNDLAKQMAQLTVLAESYVQRRQQQAAQAHLYEPGPVSLDYAEEDYAAEGYAQDDCAGEHPTPKDGCEHEGVQGAVSEASHSQQSPLLASLHGC